MKKLSQIPIKTYSKGIGITIALILFIFIVVYTLSSMVSVLENSNMTGIPRAIFSFFPVFIVASFLIFVVGRILRFGEY